MYLLGAVSIVWQAEPFGFAPAEHAAIARDRNGVRSAGRDHNHELAVKGFYALWR